VSRDWLLYLDDLIDSAEKMQRFLKGRAFEGFASDEMLFDAVLFNLEVIGEAVKKASRGSEGGRSGSGLVGSGADARLDRTSLFRRRPANRVGGGDAARAPHAGTREAAQGALRSWRGVNVFPDARLL
jgi:hypothetical protein